MSTTLHKALPESLGVDSYNTALESLLEHREDIGGFIVRNSFDPSVVPDSESFPARLILPQLANGGQNPLSEWWNDSEYNESYRTSPIGSVCPQKNGFAARADTSIKSVLTLYASLTGIQTLYVSPASEDTAKVDNIRSTIRKAPNPYTYRRCYDFSGNLNPGDIGLVIGFPTVALRGLQSAKGSLYAELSLSIWSKR